MSLHPHIVSFFKLTWKFFVTAGIVLFLSVPAFSQNSKGDKPVTNKGKVREARFKTQSKQGDKARTKDVARRRLRTKNTSTANRAATHYKSPRTAVKAGGKERGDRAAKPTGQFRGTQPSDRQKPWSRNRLTVRSATGKTRNVFPQSGPYKNGSFTRPSKSTETQGRRYKMRVQSSTGKTRNVFPQRGPYVRHAISRPKSGERSGKVYQARAIRSRSEQSHRVQSNRSTISRIQKLQATGGPGKKKRVEPRSVSRAHIGKKSVNPYAGFHRKTKKGEQAHTNDLAGRPLRQKNFESRRPAIMSPSVNPYLKRKRVGDRAYKGQAAGRHVSATRTKPHAWHGDIAGRKIRGKNHQSKIHTTGNIPGVRSRATKPRKKDKPYLTFKSGYRTATVPGEKRTGKGPISGRVPGIGVKGLGNYQGTLKAHRPLKGGGSISGRLRNNKGNPIYVRMPSGAAAKASGYPGKIKRFERSPGFSNQGEEFTGNIKARRPLKGGKSVSGKLWNNKRTPIPVRTPSSEAAKAGRYAGNIKVNSKNKEGNISQKEFNYPGKLKRFGRSPSFSNQGEEYTGNIKIKGKNKEGIVSREKFKYPGKGKFDQPPAFRNQGEEYSGNIKLARLKKNYVKNDNSADEALKKARPNKSTFAVDDLHARVKQYNYIHNRSSADAAQKVREPSKAFGRASDFQGNIKMKKFELFAKHERHPDTKFIKINKNNVASERDLMTNIKLIWARLFKKNDTQPDNLKEKERRPRYDKKEQGLWYE